MCGGVNTLSPSGDRTAVSWLRQPLASAWRTIVAFWASGQRENEALRRYVGGCHWNRHHPRAEGLRHRGGRLQHLVRVRVRLRLRLRLSYLRHPGGRLQHHRGGRVVLGIRGHAHPLTDLQDLRRVVRDSDDAAVADAHTAVPADRARLESEGEHELGHPPHDNRWFRLAR